MRIPKQHTVVLFLALLFLGLLISACGMGGASDEEIEASWQLSVHADKEAISFSRWNDDDPPEISTRCAKCHSTHGYRDFLGVTPGTTAGQVDHPAPVGATVECEACHNEAASNKNSVVMPSGLELTGLNASTNCMECHQGRASTVSVLEAVDGQSPDEVNTELSVPNIHNGAAGPTQYGSEAKGGFEYEGREYATRYEHVVEFDTCQSCHDPHAVQLQVEKCEACHLGVKTAEDAANIRTNNIDYDGDGDIEEGMAGEIETMEKRLLVAMQLYTLETEGVDPIVYNGRFQTQSGDDYTTWTPRLVQAAYNYQYSVKDSGGYAHNGKYIIQLLHDSVIDLREDVRGFARPEQ